LLRALKEDPQNRSRFGAEERTKRSGFRLGFFSDRPIDIDTIEGNKSAPNPIEVGDPVIGAY